MQHVPAEDLLVITNDLEVKIPFKMRWFHSFPSFINFIHSHGETLETSRLAMKTVNEMLMSYFNQVDIYQIISLKTILLKYLQFGILYPIGDIKSPFGDVYQIGYSGFLSHDNIV